MQVSGSKKEIEWLFQTLANGCPQCPFFKECNERAAAEAKEKEDGYAGESCEAFLKEKIIIKVIE